MITNMSKECLKRGRHNAPPGHRCDLPAVASLWMEPLSRMSHNIYYVNLLRTTLFPAPQSLVSHLSSLLVQPGYVLRDGDRPVLTVNRCNRLRCSTAWRLVAPGPAGPLPRRTCRGHSPETGHPPFPARNSGDSGDGCLAQCSRRLHRPGKASAYRARSGGIIPAVEARRSGPAGQGLPEHFRVTLVQEVAHVLLELEEVLAAVIL